MLKNLSTEGLNLVGYLVENYEEMSPGDMLNEIPRLRRFLQVANVPKEVALKWISLRPLQFILEYELQDYS